MTIKAIIDGVVGKEGKYSDHPSDTGGETMWGITIAVARANGYTGPMRAMPRSVAETIYERKYVILPGFDKIIPFSEKIAEELIDTGVNMGPGVPSEFLQRLLNALNRQGKDYPDIKVDGDIGPATLRSVKAYFASRRDAESILLKGLNCLQGARYVALAEGRGANEDFLNGWLANRVG